MKKSEIIKLTVIILAFVILAGMEPVFSEGYEKYGLIINDTFINKEITVSNMEGIAYIPLTAVSDRLGIVIKQEAESLTLSRQKHNLVLTAKDGKVFMEQNGLLEESLHFINGNIIYIPILYLRDYLGLGIEVVDELKCIRLVSKPDILYTGQLIDRLHNPGGTDKKLQTAIKPDGKYGKVAYLTFDDGLDGKVTPQILDILKHYNVKGTFFIIGNTINKNIEILKRVVAEGHSIGNHSYTHKKGIIYSDVKSFSEELERTSKAIYDAVGISTKLFRPPYGAPYIRSQEYRDALVDYEIVLWNVDSNDSRIKGIKSNEITASVKSQVKNKSNVVILFHNTSAREETVKALPEIIEYLIENRYTISALEH